MRGGILQVRLVRIHGALDRGAANEEGAGVGEGGGGGGGMNWRGNDGGGGVRESTCAC